MNKETLSLKVYICFVAGIAVSIHSGSIIAGLKTFGLWLIGSLLWEAGAFAVSRISARK